MSAMALQAGIKHNVGDEVYSVSKTLSCQNNFHHRAAETKPDGVKVAWITNTANNTQQEPRRGGKRHHALIEQLKLYCDNSSLAGYKYITQIERTWFERIMWIFLHIIMICVLGAIIWNVLQDFKNSPVVTIVDSDHYPSNLLDFPAISVCSINRISQKAAMKLAEQLISLNVTNLSIDKILLLINDLGNLYESSFRSLRNESKTDDLLKKYIADNYQLSELMKELTPKCTDILLKCRFRSSNRNCSNLFSFRKTQDGYCCLFNYVREHDETNKSRQMAKSRTKDPLKIEKLTILNSLSFLIDPYLNDYFYTILPLTGWKIMIFSPNDYPDNTSGGVTETLISPGTENFLELNAVSFFTEKAVRHFDIYDRKCIFKDEISALYNAYTYSDCIVDCKVKDIWETCGCQPFFYPIRNSHRLCTSSDNLCLHYHKTKWWSVMPHNMKEASEESRIFNFISNETWSLRCKNCYPSCDDVRYSLQTSSIVLRNDGETSFLKDIDIVNQSLVHIYFTKYGTLRLKQDRAYYWYELLSDIGSLCGVFIGFSLISAVEFIYFLVLSSARLYSGTRSISESSSDRQEESESRDLRSLYWTELKPRGKSANAKTKTRALNLPFRDL